MIANMSTTKNMILLLLLCLVVKIIHGQGRLINQPAKVAS